jgi:hypothetical protein
MTCRVARLIHNSVSRDLVSCCECGSTHLEEFLASTTLGPYLCQICARSIVECTSLQHHQQEGGTFDGR